MKPRFYNFNVSRVININYVEWAQDIGYAVEIHMVSGELLIIQYDIEDFNNYEEFIKVVLKGY